MSRKLVTIRKISEINDIDRADFIQCATVDGWDVVVKRGEFEVGDYALYFEIDSALPADDERFDFLKKSGTKTLNGKEVIRLRTVKLRKQISQGLLLPVDQFPEVRTHLLDVGVPNLRLASEDRIDLSDVLGVVKYERPEPVGGGKPAGTFPTHIIPKTDEERIQNCYDSFKRKYSDLTFQASLKLDGSSTTVAYLNNPDFFVGDEVAEDAEHQILVCSRNQALKAEDGNRWYAGLENDNIIANLEQWGQYTGRQIAIQGELLGLGIQGNREKLDNYKVFAFYIWDIDNKRYCDHEEFLQICEEVGIDTVPQYGDVQPFQEWGSVKEMLAMADGPSMNAKWREGVVFSHIDDKGNRISFKVISNKFLLKGGD